jgi:hypothetical protein
MAQTARETLAAMEVEAVRIAEREQRAAVVAEATAAPAATLRLDAPEATDSEADMQMAVQTHDVRATLQACDARVALARLGKLPKDDRSLEVERDRQRRLDRASWHRRLDRDSDDLASARVRGGEQTGRKAAAARDREAEHRGDRTRDQGGFGRGFGCIGRGDHSGLLGSKEEWVPLTKLG